MSNLAPTPNFAMNRQSRWPQNMTDRWKQLPALEKSEKNTIGFGQPATASPDDIVAAIKSVTSCPQFALPTVEEVRIALGGPLNDSTVARVFGAQFDPFNLSKDSAGLASIETTMRKIGTTQTWFFATAIGLKLQPEPLNWATLGNAWTRPAASGAQPISPDVFTQNDRANGALGAAIAAGTQTMNRATLWWGGWMNYAFWHMCRAYNLVWQISTNTLILNDMMRNTAYMPPNSQDGSSSDSQVEITEFVHRLNDYYNSPDIATLLTFLRVNRRRIGSANVGAGATNVGIFKPTNDYNLVDATFGGMDLRSLLMGNSEFRELSVPYVIPPGVAIGLYAQEVDTYQGALMRQYLSVTQGFLSTVPPFVSDTGNIAGLDGSGVSPVGLERTLDAAPAFVAQQVDSQTGLYKGGEGKISFEVKGFPVDQDWAKYLENNKTIREAVMARAGFGWVNQGA